MFQCEEDRFNDRATVIDVLVVASVVRFVKSIELTMFDHRADASIPEFVPERVPVVAFVGCDRGNCARFLVSTCRPTWVSWGCFIEQ